MNLLNSQIEAMRWGMVEYFQDFVGVSGISEFTRNKGTDGSATLLTSVAVQNGVGRMTTGANASADFAGNGTVAGLARCLQPNNAGPISIRTRIKVDLITSRSIFIGFTDNGQALEMPMYGTGGGGDAITSGGPTNATEAVGFLHDTAMATNKWFGASVKADVVQTALNTGVDPLAATWRTFGLDIDTSGNVTFSIDGTSYGSLSSAITATTVMGFVIAAFSRNTTSKLIDVDFVLIRAKRF